MKRRAFITFYTTLALTALLLLGLAAHLPGTLFLRDTTAKPRAIRRNAHLRTTHPYLRISENVHTRDAWGLSADATAAAARDEEDEERPRLDRARLTLSGLGTVRGEEVRCSFSRSAAPSCALSLKLERVRFTVDGSAAFDVADRLCDEAARECLRQVDSGACGGPPGGKVSCKVCQNGKVAWGKARFERKLVRDAVKGACKLSCERMSKGQVKCDAGGLADRFSFPKVGV